MQVYLRNVLKWFAKKAINKLSFGKGVLTKVHRESEERIEADGWGKSITYLKFESELLHKAKALI